MFIIRAPPTDGLPNFTISLYINNNFCLHLCQKYYYINLRCSYLVELQLFITYDLGQKMQQFFCICEQCSLSVHHSLLKNKVRVVDMHIAFPIVFWRLISVFGIVPCITTISPRNKVTESRNSSQQNGQKNGVSCRRQCPLCSSPLVVGSINNRRAGMCFVLLHYE